jgi:hypothetical protein
VGFGSEVDDGVYVVLADDAFHGLLVANVAADEGIARIGGNIGQVVQIAAVVEDIKDHQAIIGISLEDIADEIGTDEAGATGDE